MIVKEMNDKAIYGKKINFSGKNLKALVFNFLSVFFLTFLLFSCNQKKEEVIVFDEVHPLALYPDVSWALITDPYVAYKKEIGWDSETTGHSRSGEILQVMGMATDSEKEKWYLFEQGWLPASCLSIYSNRFKAQTAAGQLKK